MKKKSASQSAPARHSLGEGGFFNLRVLLGLFIVLAGVFLALAGFGVFPAPPASIAQARPTLTGPSIPSSSLRDLTVPRFGRWASTGKKTSGPEPS